MWSVCVVLPFLCSPALGLLATDVRLVPGHLEGFEGVHLTEYEGAVEVKVGGTWGPILRHGIDDVTVNTICRILGYGSVGFLVQRFAYSGVPLLYELKCIGNETSISECQQIPSNIQAELFDAPGVHCFDHKFTELRLVGDGSSSDSSGSVQVKMDGRWGQVCDYNSITGPMQAPTIDNAICRTLGYEQSDGIPRRGDGHGVHLSWVDLDLTTCTGRETNFDQCKFRPATIHQTGCKYGSRAVRCITTLGGSCASPRYCAAVPNATCGTNKVCVCQPNYIETKDGQCALNLIPSGSST